MSASAHRLTLNIESLSSSGEGIARLKHDVYFVSGALPGETVEVLLDGRRRKIWQTRLLKIITPSPARATPPCPHYQRCGGCDLQHLAYPEQVAFKQQRVQHEFGRQKLDVQQWLAPLVAEPWHYRRKARVGVRYSANKGENIVGFREAASTHLTNIDSCLVLPEHPALNWDLWRTCIEALDARAHITQIEVTVADNALALVLRAIKRLKYRDESMLQELMSAMPKALPVQLWVKEDKDQGARLLWPAQAEPLYHQVAGRTLQVQLDDFMQINAQVNQQMVAQALAWLDVAQSDTVWDLFAGHGNFSFALAAQCQQVLAFEGSEAMVASLNNQAQAQGVAVSARALDLTQPEFFEAKPDAVLLDPPRAGAAELMPVLAQLKPKKILYVSCDAATLARDLAMLVQAGYQLSKVGIMDMFPQTHHVETMVLLEPKAK